MARDWQFCGSLADCSTASHSALASCKDHASCRDRAKPQMTFPSCQQSPTTQLPMSVWLAAIKPLQCGRYMQRHSVRVFSQGMARAGGNHTVLHHVHCVDQRRKPRGIHDSGRLYLGSALPQSVQAPGIPVAICSGMPCMTLQMTPGMTPHSTEVFALNTRLKDRIYFFSFCEVEFLERKCAVLCTELHAH